MNFRYPPIAFTQQNKGFPRTFCIPFHIFLCYDAEYIAPTFPMTPHLKHEQKARRRHKMKIFFVAILSAGFIGTGAFLLWASTLSLPSYEALQSRKVSESTQIFDRTGKYLLYDVHQDEQRTVVPIDQIAVDARNATVAIEDANFYNNIGVEPLAIIRAAIADVMHGGYSQGGSTITQQVVKNTLLTDDKTIARKVKELVLAIKLDRTLSKDQILDLYLNAVPYGGNIYGIEQASQAYFGIHASDLSLAQAAYLAALPQAPTYYSPYGNHLDALTARQHLVLKRMLDLGFISQSDYDGAMKERVTFLPQQSLGGIKAPWFVMWVKQDLEQKYGVDEVENGGLKVTTTLDWPLEQKAEQLVSSYVATDTIDYNASNGGVVGIDPKTGEVLTMVGSKDYFDTKDEGNFNVTLAHRQPGSTFKPFVYATAFKKGYTPDTVVFDVQTNFQTTCDAQGNPLPGTDPSACYMPTNYDGQFVGPITFKEALAQSRNVPAIKALYLAGLQDSLQTAKDMGITSLGDVNQYGLTLVLGGGEVTLLDMTSAYGVFANDGIRNPYVSILKVEDRNGNVLEQYAPQPQQVLDKNIALQISSILSSDPLRAPELGVHSPLYFEGHDVAAKTGTTNDFRDAWTIGYTPDFVLGAWVGNNDNTPMVKKIAGFIVAPMWHAVMAEALKEFPNTSFETPAPEPSDIKPVLRGIWQGDQTYFTDKLSGKLATQYTPDALKQEHVLTDIHSILYWVDKDNPRGPIPTTPQTDPQFSLWEPPVLAWAQAHGYTTAATSSIPTEVDDIHGPQFDPQVSITSPAQGSALAANTPATITVAAQGHFPIARADFFINGTFIGSTQKLPLSFVFTPSQVSGIDPSTTNTLTVIVYDDKLNKSSATVSFTISS